MRSLGPKFPRIAEERGRLYVESDRTDFGEELVEREGILYRPWDARRSKLAAGVQKRLSQIGIREGDSVLYLGAAHGYTPSFISDIVGKKGVVFALDFSATVVRDLLRKSRTRTNMIPLLADAKRPADYAFRVTGVDVIFMDIAQREQVAIFLRNCERFLKEGGFGILALKARSVDMTRPPRDIFKDAYRELEQTYTVVDYRELDPYEKDHALFVVKKRNSDNSDEGSAKSLKNKEGISNEYAKVPKHFATQGRHRG
jgi:fibrillarin-like pre-rRNA processing protein